MSTSATHNAIIKAGGKDHAPMLVFRSYVTYPEVLANDDHPGRPAKTKLGTNFIVSEHTKKRINAEAEAVHIILTEIDNGKDLKEVTYHILFEILKQHQNEVNEIQAERLARNANPLALVAATLPQPSYYPQPKPNYHPPTSTTRSQDATQSKGKEITRVPSPPPKSNHEIVSDEDDTPRNKNVDNTPRTERRSRYEKQTRQYENQRAMNVAGNMDVVGNQVQDSDEEPTDQELEAHYMSMAKIQEVTPTAYIGTRPIFEKDPLEQLIEIIIFIINFGCSKHMTRNLKLFINFVEKFLGTVRFSNDQFAPIPGYKDLVNSLTTFEQDLHKEVFEMKHTFEGMETEVDEFNELKQLLTKLKGKSQVTPCEIPNLDSGFQKLKDENMSLAFQVSSLVKEREHIKYDNARNFLTRVHINCYGHPFNKHNFGLVRKYDVPKRLSWNFGYLDYRNVSLIFGFVCSKHMTGQCDKLINFISKLISIVGFRNDHFAAIMGHGDLQIGNILTSRLAKESLVKGLPKLKYVKDHLCSSCQMRKSKKESHKPKSEPSINERLQMLHMHLYGPMRVESINEKRYILVIVDDYSQFIWVKFLRTKYETPDMIIKFQKQSQVSLQAMAFGLMVCVFPTNLEVVGSSLARCEDYFHEWDSQRGSICTTRLDVKVLTLLEVHQRSCRLPRFKKKCFEKCTVFKGEASQLAIQEIEVYCNLYYKGIVRFLVWLLAIALSCNTIQHSRTKHIAVHYHFITEQVENEVVELYFVKPAYQLADIFTKALERERLKFLLNRLGMQSITPDELKSLAESDEE
ncbi:retrovirus-related pol polyprotein from transposon TNT 1-94 [Tanacetum coccineum]